MNCFNLAFSYNCAIAKYLGINDIFLMGFDGEQDAMKFHEMSETIKLVIKNKINLVSLLKTNYPLKTKSIFSKYFSIKSNFDLGLREIPTFLFSFFIRLMV